MSWWAQIGAALESRNLFHTDVHERNFIVDTNSQVKCVDLAAIRVRGLGPRPENDPDNIIWPIITYDTLRGAEQFGKLIHDHWNMYIMHQRCEPVPKPMTDLQKEFVAKELRSMLTTAEQLFLSGGAIFMFDTPGMGPEMEHAEEPITEGVKALRWAKKKDRAFSYSGVSSVLGVILGELCDRFGPLDPLPNNCVNRSGESGGL